MAVGSMLVPMPTIPRPDNSWLGSIADSLGGAIQNYKADKSFTGLADRLQGGAMPAQQPAGGFLAGLAPQAPQAPQTAPVASVERGQAQGDTFQPFISTVKAGGLTNPYGLAAVASTGKAESGWSAKNANRTWSDPSESGKPGTAGGVMSWRGPRYEALAATGDLSPEGQAKFFLQENPDLIQKLNNASSVEEAQQLMNNAWAFAGYDRPGGESARRLAMAQNYYANEFGNDPGGEPMEQGDAAPQAYRDPMVSVQNGAGPQAQASSAPYTMASPTAPGGDAPMQVAGDANPQIAAGVTPVQRGSVDPSIIQYMLRDRNLRETGLKLWAANSQGQKSSEPWQFVNLPDGTLARANQQTGAVERLGNYAKPNQDAVAVGDNLVDRTTGQVIYEGKGKAPTIVELFDEQTGQPYKAKFNPDTQSYDRVGGVKAPSNGMSVTTNPDGTTTVSMGGAKPPKLTEAEARNSGFLVRADQSQKILNGLEGEGTSLWNSTAGKIPVAGNFLRSQDAQKYDQAKRDFVNALLRRESGAVISPDEFGNAEQQYFPQPGDGPEVIAQKRANRESAIKGLDVGSGAGSKLVRPDQPQRQKTSTGVQWSIEE